MVEERAPRGVLRWSRSERQRASRDPVTVSTVVAPGTVTGFRDASLSPSFLGSEPTLLDLPP